MWSSYISFMGKKNISEQRAFRDKLNMTYKWILKIIWCVWPWQQKQYWQEAISGRKESIFWLEQEDAFYHSRKDIGGVRDSHGNKYRRLAAHILSVAKKQTVILGPSSSDLLLFLQQDSTFWRFHTFLKCLWKHLTFKPQYALQKK